MKLHYWDYGGAGNQPLILVHGALDHARSWDRIAAEFVATHHVYAVDLRGHGDSAWAPGAMYSFPEYMLDLAAFCEVVTKRPLDFIGHSLGGVTVMHYAGTFPETVRKIVNIEGWGPPSAHPSQSKPYPERLRKWVASVTEGDRRQPRRYQTFEEAVTRMKDANPHLTDDMARHLTRYGTDRTAGGALVWKFDPFVRSWPPVSVTREQAVELFGAIVCPVLFIRGMESWAEDLSTGDRMAMIRDQRFINVPDAGHWVHHDQTERVIREAKAFLND